MAIESLPAPTTRPARVLGMRCRNCGATQPIGLSYVCPACFGPLEVEYDYAVAGATLTRQAIASRAPGIWRYLELLPVDAPPARGLPVGSTPLLAADRLAPSLGLDRLLIKDDTRNPSLSFKDRAVAVAAARAVDFGVEALACASTGNLAGATAAAAAAVGLPAYVFIPADLEPAKVDHALAYGATVVPIDGTYDDVNRLCLEVADETGWGFVNINLRPFYAEGSKTLAYEIAEALGWRSPDVVVGPVASGAMFTRVARGFEELATLGLIERRPIRFVGGQAVGLRAGRDRVGGRDRRHRAGPDPGHDRPVACHRQSGRRPLRGRAGQRDRRLGRGDRRRGDRRGDPRRRPARGHLPRDGRRRDPGRGRRGAATRRHPARRRGRRPADRQRAQDAGRPDARTRGRCGPSRGAGPRPGDPAQPVGVRALAGRRGVSTVRIPPTLRVATGGAKQVEVPPGTVRQVVAGLIVLHPSLESQLIGPDGDLNRFVNAFLNDTDVRHLEDLDTPVGEGDTLVLLPAMAGG